MIKTNYFKKVENLIEMRKRLRAMTGVMESIGETIRLWRRCNKLDEYWDYYWSFKSEDINASIANLHADINEVSVLAQYIAAKISAGFPRFDPDALVNRREVESEWMFESARPMRQKLIAVQREAMSTAASTMQASESQWERWIRRDVEFPALWVREVIVRLTFLKTQIEKSWSLISPMPHVAVKQQPQEGEN